MEARREKREISAGRLKTPAEKAQIDTCSIGPNSCVPTGPNLLAIAIGAVTMATRLAQGKEIGSMFALAITAATVGISDKILN